MSESDFEVRVALPADAEAIQKFGNISFAATFGHLYPPEVLEGYLAEAYTTPGFVAHIENPREIIFVAHDKRSGEVCGYVLCGPCDLPHAEASDQNGEIKKLYVDIPFFGKGVAKQLMDLGIAWLKEHFPGKPLYIGVYSDNLRAQNFYMQKYNFERVGDYYFEVGSCRDFEFILREKSS